MLQADDECPDRDCADGRSSELFSHRNRVKLDHYISLKSHKFEFLIMFQIDLEESVYKIDILQISLYASVEFEPTLHEG